MNEHERKSNYWRGFAVATTIWTVVSVAYFTSILRLLAN